MTTGRWAALAALGLAALGGILVPIFARLHAPTLTLVTPQPGARLMLRSVRIAAKVQGLLAGGRYTLTVDGQTRGAGRLQAANGRILARGLQPGRHRLAIYVYGPGYAWHYMWRVTVLPAAYRTPPARSDLTETAISDVNAYRAAANLSPMTFSRSLAAAAQAHSNFFSRNRARYGQNLTLSVHDEQSSWPGFVGEDPYARDIAFGFNGDGDSEVMAFGVGINDAVWLWMDSVYHRFGIVDPGLTEMGFGMAGKSTQSQDLPVTVIDAGFFSNAESRDSVAVAWPPPGLTGVSTTFYEGEIPDPLANFPLAHYPAGYPVTLSFFGLHVAGLRVKTAALTLNAHPVPSWVLTPASDQHPEELGYSVAILPKNPLRPSAVYRASISGSYEDSSGWHAFRRTWRFSTAQAPDPAHMQPAGHIAVQTRAGRRVAPGRTFAKTLYLPLSTIVAPFAGRVTWSPVRPDETSVAVNGHTLTFMQSNFEARRDGHTVTLHAVPASAGRSALVPALEFARLLGLRATLNHDRLELLAARS